MKTLTPNKLALSASAIISSFVFLSWIIIQYFLFSRIPWHFALPIVLSTFIISYLVFLYTLKKFIYEKIQVIYKSIHGMKSSKDYSSENINLKTDIFGEISRDVTEWAKENRNEIEQLKKLESYRREFLGNVSHELKTPIFNIQGYILTLLEGGIQDTTINMDYLQKAAKNVERMITIIDDLESISQLEEGELYLDMNRFDIVALFKDTISALEIKAKSKNIKLKLKENYEKPIKVYADKDRIRQVITNLLVNSIKYGKEEGTTEVRFYDMDENILIEVSDNGIGIAKEHLPRLFERFYRVDKGRSRDQGGTGLGLAIVKHIIEAHEQTINVRSTEGVGSTFSFTLKKSKSI